MNAGSPRASHVDNDRLAMRQATHIHALAARHVPHPDIAAAAGCTIARVRQVLTQPIPDLHDQPEPDDLEPAPTRRTRATAAVRAVPATAVPAGIGLTTNRLLTATLDHDDATLAGLAAHIRDDITALRALYTEACARAEHAAHIADCDARIAATQAALTATHRRTA